VPVFSAEADAAALAAQAKVPPALPAEPDVTATLAAETAATLGSGSPEAVAANEGTAPTTSPASAEPADPEGTDRG
jgi:hypothetical protein